MRKPFLLLLAVMCCSGAMSGQELAQTDVDAYLLIQNLRDSWRRFQQRDPQILETIKRTSASFSFTEDRKERNGVKYAQDLLGTYYESYDLSEFRVVFTSPDEAILSFHAVVSMRGHGKRAIKSSRFTCYMKRTDTGWTYLKTLVTPAK